MNLGSFGTIRVLQLKKNKKTIHLYTVIQVVKYVKE